MAPIGRLAGRSQGTKGPRPATRGRWIPASPEPGQRPARNPGEGPRHRTPGRPHLDAAPCLRYRAQSITSARVAAGSEAGTCSSGRSGAPARGADRSRRTAHHPRRRRPGRRLHRDRQPGPRRHRQPQARHRRRRDARRRGARLPAVGGRTVAPDAADPDARPDRHRHPEPVLPGARPGGRLRRPGPQLLDHDGQRGLRRGPGDALPRPDGRPPRRRADHRLEPAVGRELAVAARLAGPGRRRQRRARRPPGPGHHVATTRAARGSRSSTWSASAIAGSRTSGATRASPPTCRGSRASAGPAPTPAIPAEDIVEVRGDGQFEGGEQAMTQLLDAGAR